MTEVSKADVSKLNAVPPDDPRLAVAAVLITDAGDVIGKATVLSSEIAVTIAEVAMRAPYPGRLLLFFPQFARSPEVHSSAAGYPVSVPTQDIDADLGFAVLRVSGIPVPVPSGLLGAGEVPPERSECEVLYCDDARNGSFRLSGRVGEQPGSRFRLYLEGGRPSPIVGAPVFKENLLVGIVASVPGGAFDPSAFSYNFDTHASPFVEVLSVAAMVRSEVTPAVRNLLARAETDPSAAGPFPTSEDDLTSAPPRVLSSVKIAFTPPAGGAAAALGDAELFARLTSSSRNALERANQIRGALNRPMIEMEYLIYGLFENWGVTRNLFEKAKIDQRGLVRVLIQIIRDSVGSELSTAFEKLESAGLPRAARLLEMPPASKHVEEALEAAIGRADERGSRSIRSRHLLYGALSVDGCRVVEVLRERGVRKEDLDQIEDEENGPDKPVPALKSSQVATPPETPERALAANPTPKVDSDLWSEEDQLGYEAYARTIASLMTHKETKPPLTIGIKAPWGAGKTTLMKRVQHLLDGDAKLSEENRSETMQQGQPSQVTLWELVKELKNSAAPGRLEAKRSKDGEAYGLEPRMTVWFNAWKYQTSEQIWAGMAHCIISQITARMKVRERELFWLRLHARRVNADEVRRKVYEMVARQLLPLALVVGGAVAIVVWVTAAIQLRVSYQFVVRGVSLLAGLIVLVWRGWSKLGEKAAGTVRELIREPDYEGKMGYLHLVESDIREVLKLATAASATQEKPEGNPLVVFVDDLDRCAPNKVAEVVEAINLYSVRRLSQLHFCVGHGARDGGGGVGSCE